MKTDITDRTGLEAILTAFYEQAVRDELIGHFFTQVVPLDMQKHLPAITDFWESVVLGSRGYGKNVMAMHQHIHDRSVIGREHLDRWVQLFTDTVAAHAEGPNATLMMQRGRSIATMMDLKLNYGGLYGRPKQE